MVRTNHYQLYPFCVNVIRQDICKKLLISSPPPPNPFIPNYEKHNNIKVHGSCSQPPLRHADRATSNEFSLELASYIPKFILGTSFHHIFKVHTIESHGRAYDNQRDPLNTEITVLMSSLLKHIRIGRHKVKGI